MEKNRDKEYDILNRLNADIGKDCIKAVQQILLGRIDAYLECNGIKLACIILYRGIENENIDDLLFRLRDVRISRLLIIKNTSDIQLIEVSLNGYKVTSLTWRDLVDFCKKLLDSLSRAPKDTSKYLADWINKKCKRLVDFTISKDDLIIDSTGVSFTRTKEKEFFEALLGARRVNKVCRYTNLDSTKISVDDKKQNMLSVVCMNDKSECYYADNFINPGFTAIKWYNKSSADIKTMIESYILSLSYLDMCDNLTMWRLYGNDAKGVSLINECPDEMPTGFYIAPVDYAKKNNKHPKLNLIKTLTKGVYEYSINFQYWNIWKHFFKPQEYDIEKEVRMVFIEDNNLATPPEKKWIISGSNKILSPMVIFPFSPNAGEIGFPLTLKQIILGSKCPEKYVNKASLQYLALQRFGEDINHEPNVKVEISKINSYRD